MDIEQYSFFNALDLIPASPLFADSTTMSPENSATESALGLHCENQVSNHSENNQDAENDNISPDIQELLSSSSFEHNHTFNEMEVEVITDFVIEDQEIEVGMQPVENLFSMESGNMEKHNDEVLTTSFFSKLPMDIFSHFVQPSESPKPLLDTTSSSPQNIAPLECDLKSKIPNFTPLAHKAEFKKEKLISCKPEHLLQDPVVETEQKPIDFSKIKKEFTFAPEKSPNTVHFPIDTVPKIGIVHRETYTKHKIITSTSSLPSKVCVNSHAPQAPILYQNQSSIESKTTYVRNSTVRFINEDNEYVVCSLNNKRGMNFDNLASKKHPKLTVNLTRIEDIKEKITDVPKSKATCNGCLLTYKNKKDLARHTTREKRSRQQHHKHCSYCEVVSESSSSNVCDKPAAQNACNKPTSMLKDKSPDSSCIKLYRKYINCFKQKQLLPFIRNSYKRPIAPFCRTCNRSFISIKALLLHNKKYHIKTLLKCVNNVFSAPIIKKEIAVAPELVEVKVEEKDEKKFILNCCHICNFQALTRCHLEFHLKSHMMTNIKEEKIETETKPTSNIQVPQIRVSNLFQFDAESKEWFKFNPQGKRKKIFKTKTSSNQVPRYVCKMCSKMYRKIHSYRSHAMQYHLDQVGSVELLEIIYVNPQDDADAKAWFGKPAKTYTCKICSFASKNKQAIQTHMYKDHCDSDSE